MQLGNRMAKDNGLKDSESLLPARWILFATGIWYPTKSTQRNFNCAIRVFGTAVYLSVALVTLYVHLTNYKLLHMKIKPLCIVNGLSMVNSFLSPGLLIYFFLRSGHYKSMVDRVNRKRGLQCLSTRCSAVTFIIWAAASSFFFSCWQKSLVYKWQTGLYALVVGVMTLPWASGLSIFIFCTFVYMKDTEILEGQICQWYAFDTAKDEKMEGSLDEEREYQAKEKAIKCTNKMLTSWSRTSYWLNVYMSWQVSSHVFNIIVYSCLYWQENFGPRYPNFQYLGTLLIDNVGIVLCIYFAAQVSESFHKITKRVGVLCVPNEGTNWKIPYERLDFHRYLHDLQQGVGLKIVGIKIAVNIALVATVTIIMSTVSFTTFFVARLQDSN